MRQIDHIVIHHSASPRTTTAAQIDQWHRGKGWAGVGYHFVVEVDGNLVRGRPPELPGAHVRGHNQRSLGICLVGDNTTMGQRWTQSQVETLKALLSALTPAFPQATVLGHRDMPGTSTLCPGLTISELLHT